MSLRHGIQLQGPPGADLATRAGGFLLPPELLQQFRGRVEHLMLVFLAMCIVAFGIETVLNDHLTPLHAVYGVNGVGSLAVYLVARSKRLTHRLVLNAALVFEVVMCLMVSLGFTYTEVQASGRLPAVTWICIVIVMYPLIVPCPPVRTLVTAVAAAASAPLSAAVMEWLDLVQLTGVDYFVVSISPTFCVAVAVLSSRVVHGLSREVAEARRAGRYRLTEKIGSGGMGEVWRAEHEMLARPAAVKLIRPEALREDDPSASETAVVRFEREVQATALLHSPHTVDVYDFGIAEDGSFYYVMELLEGLDLQTLVEKHGPLPAERVVHMLEQVCLSLEEAHRGGLVHRDIKPANLFACRYGTQLDFIKVVDFGLVKAFAGMDADPSHLTEHDAAVGTPRFMAPEVAVAPTSVDGRADIYSLGCVGYWLLTGTPVFDAESVMAVIVKHVRDAPEPPSRRTKLEIPAALEQLIMKCLNKDPAARPTDARALREELEALRVDAWSQERMESWWQAHEPPAVS